MTLAQREAILEAVMAYGQAERQDARGEIPSANPAYSEVLRLVSDATDWTTSS
jgi:hypothetical protein